MSVPLRFQPRQRHTQSSIPSALTGFRSRSVFAEPIVVSERKILSPAHQLSPFVLSISVDVLERYRLPFAGATRYHNPYACLPRWANRQVLPAFHLTPLRSTIGLPRRLAAYD